VAPLTVRQALVGLAVGVAGTVALRFARGLPWSLAAVAGLAMAILAVSSWRTGDHLRALFRAGRGDDAGS